MSDTCKLCHGKRMIDVPDTVEMSAEVMLEASDTPPEIKTHKQPCPVCLKAFIEGLESLPDEQSIESLIYEFTKQLGPEFVVELGEDCILMRLTLRNQSYMSLPLLQDVKSIEQLVCFVRGSMLTSMCDTLHQTMRKYGLELTGE